MLRRWLFFIVIILFLGSIISGYFYLRTIKREVTSPINAIPQSAVLVFESNNFLQNWHKQSGTSLIFKELKTFNGFSDYDSLLVSFDSTLRKSPNTAFLFNEWPVLVSLVRSGAKTFDLLYTLNLPPEIGSESFINHLNTSIFDGFYLAQKQFDQAIIYTQQKDKAKFSYSLYKDVLSFSTNAILVEDAIKQLNSEASLLNNKDFIKAYETRGKGNDGNFYVNSEGFLAMLSDFFKPNNNLFQTPINFSSWAAFDLFLKPNNLMLNGFFNTEDSTGLFLNRFKSQKPQSQEILNVLPKNTAFITSYGVSSFKSYYKAYLTELDLTNQKFDYDKQLQALQDSIGILPVEALSEFTENEFGLAVLEPLLSSPQKNALAYFKSVNPEAFLKKISVFSNKVDSFEVEDEQLGIFKIKNPNLLKVIYGDAFGVIDDNFFLTLNGYQIFSNNLTVLKDVAIKYYQGNTLAKDISFNAFQENLGSESNWFLYFNLARSAKLFSGLFNDDADQFLKENDSFFRQFEAFSIQVSTSKNNLSYANLFLNHNPGYKQESGSLWEIKLPSPLITKPFAFTNHYTKAKEIFIQDSSNTCYLISNTGKVLWEKKLDNPIISKIYQVDAYQNNKYQLLFSTSNAVYLLDRKGRFVENYPIEVKGITSGFECLDYDNNLEYRLLVPTVDGKILNYNILGEKVSGWKYESTKNPVSEIQYFQKNRKDYIVCVFADGEVTALNRRGERRLSFKNKLPFDSNLELFIEPSEKLSSTALIAFDSLRNVHKLHFNDKLETFTQTQTQSGKNANAGFGFEGEDLSTFYITTINGQVNIFNKKLELSNQLETEFSYFLPPQTFVDAQGKVTIALVAPNEKRVFLINQFGRLIENYPFTGSSLVCIDDFNLDGNLNLVTATSVGKLFMYSLNN